MKQFDIDVQLDEYEHFEHDDDHYCVTVVTVR